METAGVKNSLVMETAGVKSRVQHWGPIAKAADSVTKHPSFHPESKRTPCFCPPLQYPPPLPFPQKRGTGKTRVFREPVQADRKLCIAGGQARWAVVLCYAIPLSSAFLLLCLGRFYVRAQHGEVDKWLRKNLEWGVKKMHTSYSLSRKTCKRILIFFLELRKSSNAKLGKFIKQQ